MRLRKPSLSNSVSGASAAFPSTRLPSSRRAWRPTALTMPIPVMATRRSQRLTDRAEYAWRTTGSASERAGHFVDDPPLGHLPLHRDDDGQELRRRRGHDAGGAGETMPAGVIARAEPKDAGG